MINFKSDNKEKEDGNFKTGILNGFKSYIKFTQNIIK